jgi:hypothetical protein
MIVITPTKAIIATISGNVFIKILGDKKLG